ncbi:MAG: hypothetical protein QG584_2599 [Pseudomonadota bacterium]|nr:hypothetical protein [Pseudomonadota bacterium]MDQ5916705.1 hypothetical protein [Pseudomonadota bacterium]MDQ5918913.1 hypothetical protein [Pseudomonadota bacterium]
MTDPTHIADDILCLAHTHSRLEWCDRRETCQRHLAIRSPSLPKEGFGVLYRVCQPNAHDQFIEAKA